MNQTIEALTREQVCQAIRCSLRKLSYMLENNAFPPGVRIGRYDYWTPIALDRWRQTQFEAQENWRPLTERTLSVVAPPRSVPHTGGRPPRKTRSDKKVE